jgi:hypothetical protein
MKEKTKVVVEPFDENKKVFETRISLLKKAFKFN